MSEVLNVSFGPKHDVFIASPDGKYEGMTFLHYGDQLTLLVHTKGRRSTAPIAPPNYWLRARSRKVRIREWVKGTKTWTYDGMVLTEPTIITQTEIDQAFHDANPPNR